MVRRWRRVLSRSQIKEPNLVVLLPVASPQGQDGTPRPPRWIASYDPTERPRQ